MVFSKAGSMVVSKVVSKVGQMDALMDCLRVVAKAWMQVVVWVAL